MYIPPRDQRAVGGTGDYEYGRPCPDGDHDAVILWNEDGVSTAGNPKITIRLGIEGGAKVDAHLAVGTISFNGFCDALGLGDQEVKDGSLRGQAVRVKTVNKAGENRTFTNVVKFYPAEKDPSFWYYDGVRTELTPRSKVAALLGAGTIKPDVACLMAEDVDPSTGWKSAADLKIAPAGKSTAAPADDDCPF